MYLLNGKKFPLPTAGYGIDADGAIYPGACPAGVDGVNHPRGTGPLFSVAGRTALGITEVPDPVRPDERFYWVTENDDGSLNVTPKDLAPIKEQFKTLIDQACGGKRSSAVSQGTYIEEEYRRAYDDAIAFRAGGYAGQAPASVQSWIDASGMTAQEAADDIIATRDGYMALLDAIRAIRLSGKAAVDGAATPETILAALNAVHTGLAAL